MGSFVKLLQTNGKFTNKVTLFFVLVEESINM